MQSSALSHRAAFGRKTLSVRISCWVLLALIAGICVVQQTQAQTQVQTPGQSASNFRVEVQVVNQSDSERSSAYWLAFDRVLREQVETRLIVEPFQREELMEDPSRFVQSARYRRYDPISDNVLLATRSVREGTEPTAVIAVTFPTDLAAIIQQQLIPVVEDQDVQTILPVIALVAVEQQGSQFIIDLQLISAEDIFNGDTDRISNFVSRFEGNDLLTGALYRLSSNTWQSDWNFSSREQPAQTFGLTTATLDEALVSAMTQLNSSSNGGFLSSGGSVESFSRAGLAIRIENIRSLADYDNVLAALRELDRDVVTETLDVESMVFRASEQGSLNVRESLINSRNFEVINADQFAGELSFRYLAQ